MVDIDRNDPEQLAAYFNAETAQIGWEELERFYAQGVVLHVADELDLVQVAVKLAQDDTEQFQRWIEADLVGRLSDENAQRFHANRPTVWAVVAAPWVLVQENKS